MSEFNANEFADYWDSIEEDIGVAEDFMAGQLATESGRDLIAATVEVLANRHGSISHKKLVTFRAAMRNACKRAGLPDIWTFKKIPGTGTKKHSTYGVRVVKAKAQENPRSVDPVAKAVKRMSAWIAKGECTVDELAEAMSTVAFNFR